MKSLGLAVIGCGKWGMNHVRTAARVAGKQFVAVCDTREENLAAAMQAAPSAKRYFSVEEICADPAVTAVVIATPADTHYRVTKQCLESGKDVLVEKPLALFSHQAEELKAIAASRGLILMVGHLLLYHPAIRKIKELVDSGAVGNLQYIYSNRLNLGTVRSEENILWSFAPHDISVLQYLIGEAPVQVSAHGGVFLQPGIQDVTLTILKYARNIQAHIHVSWLHPFKEHRLVVIGDKSMLVFEDSRAENKLLLYPKGIDRVNGKLQKRESDFQPVPYDSVEPLVEELNHFIDCVSNRSEPLTHVSSGIDVLKILEKAQASMEKNTSVEIAKQHSEGVMVHETARLDEGSQVGKGTKIWHYCHVQKGAVIGENCSLGQNVNVAGGTYIGNHVKIQNNVSIYEGVHLEDYVFCGPSCVFTNITFPRCEFPQRGSEFYQTTRVGRGASIGANATIVCGKNIGKYAFIAAGAVVTRDVPDYALVMGNPAHVAGWVCRCGMKLEFTGASSDCSKCKRKYQKSGEGKQTHVTCTSDLAKG